MCVTVLYDCNRFSSDVKFYLNAVSCMHNWVLRYQEDSDAGLRIFTEDIEEVRSLPRQQVIDHLQSCAEDLAIPYLVSYTLCMKAISLIEATCS